MDGSKLCINLVKAQRIAETIYGESDEQNLSAAMEVIRKRSEMDPLEPLFHKKEKKIPVSLMLSVLVLLYNGTIQNGQEEDNNNSIQGDQQQLGQDSFAMTLSPVKSSYKKTQKTFSLMLLNSDKKPALLNIENQNQQRDNDGDWGRYQQQYQRWESQEDNIGEGADQEDENEPETSLTADEKAILLNLSKLENRQKQEKQAPSVATIQDDNQLIQRSRRNQPESNNINNNKVNSKLNPCSNPFTEGLIYKSEFSRVAEIKKDTSRDKRIVKSNDENYNNQQQQYKNDQQVYGKQPQRQIYTQSQGSQQINEISSSPPEYNSQSDQQTQPPNQGFQIQTSNQFDETVFEITHSRLEEFINVVVCESAEIVEEKKQEAKDWLYSNISRRVNDLLASIFAGDINIWLASCQQSHPTPLQATTFSQTLGHYRKLKQNAETYLLSQNELNPLAKSILSTPELAKEIGRILVSLPL